MVKVMPGFIKPQLATLKARAPVGSKWIHEIKYDGYRLQIHINAGRKKVYTRNGHDWTAQFGYVAPTLAKITKGSLLIDGSCELLPV